MNSLKRKTSSDENTKYQCGQCKKYVLLAPRDQVKCIECGYRILYKVRSKRPSEYYAR